MENEKVGVEQIQKISTHDAYWEGVKDCDEPDHDDCFYGGMGRQCSFESLWDSIHSNDGFNWQSNPFVWVVKFKLMKGNENGSND